MMGKEEDGKEVCAGHGGQSLERGAVVDAGRFLMIIVLTEQVAISTEPTKIRWIVPHNRTRATRDTIMVLRVADFVRSRELHILIDISLSVGFSKDITGKFKVGGI